MYLSPQETSRPCPSGTFSSPAPRFHLSSSLELNCEHTHWSQTNLFVWTKVFVLFCFLPSLVLEPGTTCLLQHQRSAPTLGHSHPGWLNRLQGDTCASAASLRTAMRGLVSWALLILKALWRSWAVRNERWLTRQWTEIWMVEQLNCYNRLYPPQGPQRANSAPGSEGVRRAGQEDWREVVRMGVRPRKWLACRMGGDPRTGSSLTLVSSLMSLQVLVP